MFNTRSSRRTKVLALAGLASALVASAAFPLLAGAETASPSVTATATPTSGLVDGQVINIHVDAIPPGNPTSSQIFGVEARICKPGATIDFSADFNPTQTGNCVLNPLSPGSDTKTQVATAPPNTSADLTFKVGVGTDNYVDQSANPVSITCNVSNPCKLVLKLQVPGATQFKSFPLTYAGAPDSPTAPSAVAGDTTAALSWTAPVNTGNAPIDFYRITPSIGAPFNTPTNATTFNATGLTNFSPYTFTVEAHNSSGFFSAPSAATTAVTPGPSPATGVSAIGADQSANVSWNAPSNTTGLDYYRVTPYIGGVAQAPQNTPGTATNLVVTGLTNGTVYTFSVAAHYTPPGAFGPESLFSGNATPNGTYVTQVISAQRPAGTLDIAEGCATGGTPQFGTYPQTCNVVLPAGVLNAAATYYETSGAIQKVSVRDTRDIDAGWNVNAQLSNFVGVNPANTFSGGCLGFTPTATALSNNPPVYTQTVTAGAPVASNCAAAGLTSSTVALTGATNAGLGRADLDAAINLSIPVSANADTYSATLTLTVI